MYDEQIICSDLTFSFVDFVRGGKHYQNDLQIFKWRTAKFLYLGIK